MCVCKNLDVALTAKNKTINSTEKNVEEDHSSVIKFHAHIHFTCDERNNV